MRRWLLMAALQLVLTMALVGCSGNPFKSLSILSVTVIPDELPPEGGQVQITVEATRGDSASARVSRYGDWLFASFTVRLSEVIAIDFEKKRWKGTIDLPSNRTPKDQRYIIVITVWEDYRRDQRIKEVIVRASGSS
ncbi:MAG: hypothetical protein RMK18_03625 [Armatimonadota bacterium]|nr:hypothetical protein [Armatimonadota bacterium]MDW8024938.1 hypothetical protein [Armatimonadota bacterium]